MPSRKHHMFDIITRAQKAWAPSLPQNLTVSFARCHWSGASCLRWISRSGRCSNTGCTQRCCSFVHGLFDFRVLRSGHKKCVLITFPSSHSTLSPFHRAYFACWPAFPAILPACSSPVQVGSVYSIEKEALVIANHVRHIPEQRPNFIPLVSVLNEEMS